ncbi:Microcystin-dependent protein [Roseivivax lentus]|uniref:Microcystin-dependent protein n=1 Tax=Roseivivax lentus TaxID=633194 RepID=A0A1N7PR49_9RHOB|nr:tail fiber protein [Roseivivax lentus]SIT13104.1 Microcystin-dependent protein [Roseivivax lentus]
MSEPFVGQITMFAGNFAPRGWAFCDGQLIAVSQNDALFSLLGTIYGGDGRTTFALPDMRGRLPVHQGTGPGLSDRKIGAKGGQEYETLTIQEMATHSHSFHANTATATSPNPQGNLLAEGAGVNFYNTATPDQTMNPAAIASAGGSQSHINLMPSLCVNFIIALFGIYPSRS